MQRLDLLQNGVGDFLICGVLPSFSAFQIDNLTVLGLTAIDLDGKYHTMDVLRTFKRVIGL